MSKFGWLVFPKQKIKQPNDEKPAMKNDEMHSAYAYAYIVNYTPKAERGFVCSAFNKLMKIESNEEKKKSKINTRINTNINCKE